MSAEEPKHADAIEYLQTAAIEAIRAMRSFLDVAEGLVREPETAAMVGRAFAEAAASAFRPSTLADDAAKGHQESDERNGDEHSEHSSDDEEPTRRVRRIDLSD